MMLNYDFFFERNSITLLKGKDELVELSSVQEMFHDAYFLQHEDFSSRELNYSFEKQRPHDSNQLND